eukprot:m.513219 g.513219  ORF g.513219 m.513219 type:complete len:82 (+) comp57438_c0_seq73:1604-1849(+)
MATFGSVEEVPQHADSTKTSSHRNEITNDTIHCVHEGQNQLDALQIAPSNGTEQSHLDVLMMAKPPIHALISRREIQSNFA